MIQIIEISLTYCHRCKKPAKCAEIEMSEWSHKLDICSACLMEFAKKIDMSTEVKRDGELSRS